MNGLQNRIRLARHVLRGVAFQSFEKGDSLL